MQQTFRCVTHAAQPTLSGPLLQIGYDFVLSNLRFKLKTMERLKCPPVSTLRIGHEPLDAMPQEGEAVDPQEQFGPPWHARGVEVREKNPGRRWCLYIKYASCRQTLLLAPRLL